MIIEIEPKDALNLPVKWVNNIIVTTEQDRQFVSAMQWLYSLHPEVKGLLVPSEDATVQLVLKWPSEDEDKELFDIHEAISVFTVPPTLPVCGLAEHFISLKRLFASNVLEIQNGEGWAYAANKHIWNVCQ